MSHFAIAQDGVRENPFISLGFTLGADAPAGDLSDRFGTSMHSGISLRVFSPKAKGFFALEVHAQHGSNVKEDPLAAIRLSTGAILGDDGSAADVFLRRRGAYLGLYASRFILSSKENPFAGLAFGFGVGIWQHNIKFLDERSSARQLTGDYAKGYDRSTRGPALKQTLSYDHIGRNQSLNYSLGISVMEGFTKSVRQVNFDTGLSDTAQRLDLLISLEATWYLPIRDFEGKKEVFY